MKMSKQVAKTAAIAIILLMASVMLMAIPEPVKAQTQLPPGVTPTNLQEGGLCLFRPVSPQMRRLKPRLT